VAAGVELDGASAACPSDVGSGVLVFNVYCSDLYVDGWLEQSRKGGCCIILVRLTGVQNNVTKISSQRWWPKPTIY